MSLYRDQLEAWLKTIKVNSDRIVDIGGASKPAKNRIAECKTEQIMYLDNGAEEAKESYIMYDINKPNADQRQGFPEMFYRFGAVFCLEVFEYVWNPVQAMKNIYELMNDDSVAYISFPAIYPVHNPVDIDYMRYTKNGIIKLLLNAGFKAENISITPREATAGRLHLANFYASEGMHPVRHSNLPFDIGYLVKVRRLTNG